MATTAQYVPVVGNFKAEDGFRLINSAGDEVPRLAVPGFGEGRKGLAKLGLSLLVFGGPVGADASFKLRVPFSRKLDPAVIAANRNFYFPTGGVFFGQPGSAAQDLYIPNITFDVALNTMEFDLMFGSPVAALFAASLYLDFGFSMTE